MTETKKATALVLAASRRGPADAVAQIQGVSHKCLVTLDDVVMLERVVNEIKNARGIDRVFVSIESEELLRSVPTLAAMLNKGEIHFVPSADNLYLSVAEATAKIEDPYPMVITTGDNALHTTEMVEHFCADIAESKPDAAIAMTPASVILEAYPEGKRAFHNLKDGGWSSCNLYALANDKALKAAKIFEGGGQFGKKPQRIMKAFGLMFMLLYRYKLATIDQLARMMSRRWKLDVRVVRMPFADAPIDVDNPGDFALTERILKSRRQAAE
ncbi:MULTISPECIES: NTP transferase domain-containing protein [Kordiimonas]|jgi:GTP:adenosylcobinamide-phosphate guanylyltransferase|uniref:NTP transferase domain-containing protein n=1 Tax=Kordiimonas TaxID=288021 RepID=UPI002579F455|nr:NTP transferase domain-containing protein [Kordiimonas sp. UBA4487]